MMENSNYTIKSLSVGQTASIEVVLTQAHIDTFSQLSGDLHPLHSDKDYAQRAGFKNVIAHGALLSGLSSRLIGMYLPGLHSLVLTHKAEYLQPVFPNDKLTLTASVTRIRKSLAIVVVTVLIINQNDQKVSEIEYTVKIREDSGV